MCLKYCLVILFLFNKEFVNSFRFFEITNSFKHLSETLRYEEAVLLTDIKTRWIDQQLDNFDQKEMRTWKMRYFERINFWRLNGPIYLLMGGEAPASSVWTRTGIMYELAKETNGAMYVSEHRYYGESKPLNTSNVKNFKFLTSRQALADIAKLLQSIKLRPMFRKSKVVVIGGSYAGNLAAWMRLLYPELVDVALASSGPVLAKKDFYEYLEKVGENYERYGTTDCLNRTRYIFNRYDDLLQTPEGTEQLKKEEKICEDCDLTVRENQHLFFITKISDFMYNSQYGNTVVIENHCRYLESSLQPTESQEESKPSFFLKRQQCICYNFNDMIEEYKTEEYDWIMAWTYQTCTEFGYFQTSSSEAQPFTDNVGLDFYIKTCTALFGAEFDEKRVDYGVKKTNKFYGGLTPNVTKVIFTNGDLDPWSTLSVLENLSCKAPAMVIPRASHCQDLLSSTKNDIEELKEARKRIKQLIKIWIS